MVVGQSVPVWAATRHPQSSPIPPRSYSLPAPSRSRAAEEPAPEVDLAGAVASIPPAGSKQIAAVPAEGVAHARADG